MFEKGFNVTIPAAEVADALEKASAKKVTSINRRFHTCPTCDQALLFTIKYCNECGQKLDWTDGYMD